MADPHKIKTWCLGNEMDGPGRLARRPPVEYGRLASQTAHAMRLVDPSIELVACGSSNSQMPTFPEWEATVLDHAYGLVDYISLHIYYRYENDDLGTFLAQIARHGQFHRDRDCDLRFRAGQEAVSKQINLSFDEWNVWYHHRQTIARSWPVNPGRWRRP